MSSLGIGISESLLIHLVERSLECEIVSEFVCSLFGDVAQVVDRSLSMREVSRSMFVSDVG